MLNELMQAADAIPDLPGTLHKSLKSLPKYPGFKVSLDANGAICGVARIENVAALRKWQPSANGVSLPAFSATALYHSPITKARLDAAITDPQVWPEMFAEIRARCAAQSGEWMDSRRGVVIRKYRASLHDVPAQLQSLLPKGDPAYAVLNALCDRLQKSTPDDFFSRLAGWLEVQLGTAYDASLLALYCATGETDKGDPCSIVLDVAEWDEIGDYPIAHTRTTELLDALLSHGRTAPESADPPAQDAYGRPAANSGETFPDVNVPGLGRVSLRAMTGDAPCQYRYGLAGSDSFLVGGESRDRAKSALETLTRADRKGKTWQFRGGGLYLFYAESEIDLGDAAIADLCSLPDDDDDEQAGATATFEARAERIAAALDGKHREMDTPVHVVVLRKPDGHRTKLVAHHTFAMRRLLDAAKEWVFGARTCPPVSFARWGDGKGVRNDIKQEPPYPYQVARWLNTFWVCSGDRMGRLDLFSGGDALTLLLATDGTERDMARRALHCAISGWSGFLVAAGAQAHRSVVLKAGDKRSAALAALPTILSLLTFKLDPDTTREGTMSSPAFLVGRLLALTDSLHLQYCAAVRNGGTPAQLLGNALMATALDSPTSALALYGQRIAPYHAWARTCKAHGNGPELLAKHFLSQIVDVCTEINEQDIPQRTTDADKARIILGYLSKT